MAQRQKRVRTVVHVPSVILHGQSSFESCGVVCCVVRCGGKGCSVVGVVVWVREKRTCVYVVRGVGREGVEGRVGRNSKRT